MLHATADPQPVPKVRRSFTLGKPRVEVQLQFDPAIVPEVTDAQRESDLRKEFQEVHVNYTDQSQSINWDEICPTLQEELGEDEAVDVVKHLLKVDMMNVLKTFFLKDDPDRKKYGYLPLMATHSRGSIGSLLSSSFAERINSAANLVLTKGNSVLDPVTVDMLVVLRMNRSFMQHMREKYKTLSKQAFNVSVVTTDDNGPEDDEVVELVGTM